MKQLNAFLISTALLLFAVACSAAKDNGKVIKSVPAGNNLTVAVAAKDGVLKRGNTEFTLTFADTSGKPVDVGAVALVFKMAAMGSMSAMNAAATFTTTDTPGVYRGRANVGMSGEWQVQISYDGPAGRGQVTVPLIVQ